MTERIPTEVSAEQYRRACVAFAKELGINANAMYFPTHLDADRITFPAVPSSDLSVEHPVGIEVSGNVHPQGEDFGELSVMVTIKVV